MDEVAEKEESEQTKEDELAEVNDTNTEMKMDRQ